MPTDDEAVTEIGLPAIEAGDTKVMPAVRPTPRQPPELPRRRWLGDLLDFSTITYRPEDRWLRFALRAGFVLFVSALEAVVVFALTWAILHVIG